MRIDAIVSGPASDRFLAGMSVEGAGISFPADYSAAVFGDTSHDVQNTRAAGHNSSMSRINKHLRRTFLAGILSAVPLAVTVYIIWKVDKETRSITQALFKVPIPFLGIVIAIVAIYLCGLLATSLLGKFFLSVVDKVLSRVPFLRQLYVPWKQIALTPAGSEGTFSRVVLIPDETGATHLLGFCSGRPLDGDPNTYCVFVPAAPNPINGRLYFVHREKCIFINLSTEEAFKVVLSTGNYIPPEVGAAAKLLSPPSSVVERHDPSLRSG